ncbi:alpha/beta fold hydrolase [Pseudoduganella plicata]|uniref:Alpha/beta hydrolase n=1 Tax=Pseudoduganella plicata TaxID=321984 RepID=A0A4P7BC78_9BURK|nr:alpha/beta hydrolase [Pseudoduganella plicata]QBQ36114.1 alpha/beta hydrolase [Pseudoduganella plicata]GGY77985.1 alpha/beta hydrolase [Pseudoduganella plicata]
MGAITVNGDELYIETIDGDERLPVLVFLHEGLGSVAHWRDFPHRICAATGHPGLMHDRLGYGHSSPLRATRTIHYLHEYALRELPAVLASIEGRDYILVGHSDGGSIALIHAAGQPHGLRGVVTLAAHVIVETLSVEGIRAAQAAFDEGKLRGLERYHGAKTAQIFGAWADTWLRPSFAHWDIRYLLPSIDCPVLALQGSADQYGTVAQLDAIAAGVPKAEVRMLDGCGHSPHQERPDMLVEIIADFCAAYAGSTR